MILWGKNPWTYVDSGITIQDKYFTIRYGPRQPRALSARSFEILNPHTVMLDCVLFEILTT